MLQYEELKFELKQQLPALEELADALNLDGLRQEENTLQAQSAEPGFWDDIENSQKVQKRLSEIQSKLKKYAALQAKYDDAMAMIELADEAEDLSFEEECKESIEDFKTALEDMTLLTLLTGEYDSKNAIIKFSPGSGGTEAQDWAQMLLRLYTR